MADVKKNCSKCGEKNVKVTKKGFNKKGQQIWKCSKCNKTFFNPNSKVVRPPKKAAIKISVPKKTSKIIKEKKIITTKIFVNSNEIKEVHKDINEDEAFDMISTYFREITKTNVDITRDKNGNKKIQFVIKTGTKG